MSHHKEVSNDDCLRMFQQYVLLHYIMLLHKYSSVFESGNSYIRECELIFEGKKRHDKHSYLLLTTTLSYTSMLNFNPSHPGPLFIRKLDKFNEPKVEGKNMRRYIAPNILIFIKSIFAFF